MSDERVSNEDIRLLIRLCENSLSRGGPHHLALLDLLDARKELEDRTAERGAARQVVAQYKQELVSQEQRIKELEQERDEARAALLDVYEGNKLCYAASTIDAISAARAAAKDEK